MFKNWYFLIGFILTLSLLWPLFTAPYFSHQDNVQTMRIYEMDQCFKDGQLPCRWVPDLGGGYGYPLFNYYAPLPYYIGELAFLLTGNLFIAAKFIFALPLILSYIFMYLFASKLWEKVGGSLSAIFYIYAPYHALNMYVRGAMGELWAFAFFPAIFWAYFRLKENSNLGNSLLLGLFLSLLILSHNLSTMLLLPILFVLMIFHLWRHKNFRFLEYCGLAIIFGAALSAFYFLPVIFERDLVHLETTVEGYFSYTEHFKGLTKLLINRDWTYGDSNREIPDGPRDGLSYQIGWVHLLGLVISLWMAKVLWKGKRSTSLIIIFFNLVILVSMFMIHPRSYFVWQWIEPLKYLQFPWRFLILISFFISVLAGSIFLIQNREKNQKKIWIILTILVVSLNFSFFKPEKLLNITQPQLLSADSFNKLKMYAIFDFLPKSAEAPPANPAPGYYEILAGQSEIRNLEKGSNWLKFSTQTTSHTIVRINQYYFPTWVIKVDGNPVVFDYKNSLGLMNVLLGEGNHSVEVRLHDTPIRSIGNFTSTLGILIFISLSLFTFEPARKKLTYYFKAFNK